PLEYQRFAIGESEAAAPASPRVSADLATCDACLAEMGDPADRRHGYPFINCTDCGPRFTIVRAVPYDRALTTMADFRMCTACETEYHDPSSRRFHAQPNACPRCGPHAFIGQELDVDPSALVRFDAIAETVTALRDGLAAAIKGLGGFHLA